MALNLLARLWPAIKKPTQAADLPVWKTVKLGTCKTADEYRKALKKAGRRIGDWANDILGKPAFTASEMETEVDLVVATVAELGLKGGQYKDICTRAVEMGLELCPAEVGPALRLVYDDQPKGEWLIIAMEAITDSDGDLGVFGVERGYDGLWLDGYYGHPEHLWSSDARFVLVRRKS
jgi:hypothetical protein